jgi:hypothetical protein
MDERDDTDTSGSVAADQSTSLRTEKASHRKVQGIADKVNAAIRIDYGRFRLALPKNLDVCDKQAARFLRFNFHVMPMNISLPNAPNIRSQQLVPCRRRTTTLPAAANADLCTMPPAPLRRRPGL